MALPVPLARASADSTCSRVKEFNIFFKPELSSGYFYTLQSDSGECDMAMGWLLPGAFGCFALPTSFPAYIIPNSTRANGIKLPLIAAQPISAIYYIAISPPGCLTLPFSIPVSHLIRHQIPHHWPARSLQTNLAGEFLPSEWPKPEQNHGTHGAERAPADPRDC